MAARCLSSRCFEWNYPWQRYHSGKKRCRKIIDDFRLWHLNDLFEIKLIILRYESYIATFLICMDATFFSISRKSFLTVFTLNTQQIRVRLVAIKSDYFSPYAYTPLIFSRTLPFIEAKPWKSTIVPTSKWFVNLNVSWQRGSCQLNKEHLEF